MKCPIDQSTLTMTERQGIEIDYCPECRGVWLDRGELDKLTDAGAGPRPAAAPQQQYREERPQQYREERPPQYDDRRHKDDHYYKKKKKESFLKDLFDF